MRIISGRAKGRKLMAPPGLSTRPVTDKIREALFSIWQAYIYEANFLDLYSGSGSMGLEAMSRGAGKVYMIEKSPSACKLIKENILHCGLQDTPHEVFAEDIFQIIPKLKQHGEKFDIIYIDPPFTVDSLFEKTMNILADGKLVAEFGTVIIRTRTGRPLADKFGVLKKIRIKKYGISQVHFYEIEE